MEYHTARDRIVPTFPNARYYVQAGEVEHAHEQHERDRVSYMTDNYDPLIQSGQMQLLHGSEEIVPGISVQVYPGHTRDMQAVMIESGGQKACYISDLIPTRAHMEVIWVMAYDLYPMESIESRRQFYSRALPENWLVSSPMIPTIHGPMSQETRRANMLLVPFRREIQPVHLTAKVHTHNSPRRLP